MRLSSDCGSFKALHHRSDCFAAYVLSLLASQDLKGQILGLGSEECPPPPVTTDLMNSLTAKRGSETSLACLRESSQKEVSLQIDLNNHQILSAKISDLGIVREVARLGSLGLPHAGAWLNVVPSPTLGLHFHPREFIVSVMYRLGMKIFPAAGKCIACPQPSDVEGDHAIACGYAGERIARHDQLRIALYDTCSQACLALSLIHI